MAITDQMSHDDVIKWKRFPRYWPFVQEVPGEFPTQRPVTQGFEVFFDLRLNKRLSNREAGDLRRYRARYDVTVMNDVYLIWHTSH